MNKNLVSSLPLAFVLFLGAGCSNDPTAIERINGVNPSNGLLLYNADSKVQLVDEQNRPLSNVKVLFGDRVGSLDRNFVVTDENGEVAKPAEFDSATMPITVDGEGYVRQTVFGLSANTLTLKLKTDQKRYELRGTVKNLPIKNGDGVIDFALVMPALTKKDLLNFDLNTVMSPYIDTISVLSNDLNLPSNVSLPKQNERYFFSVTLEKPIYRTYFKNAGSQRIFAAQGRFPFKDVVDEFREGKQFYDLINHFTITGGALRDVNIAGASTNLDMPANELKFAKKMTAKAPAANKDEVLIAVAANKINDYMVPSDVKRLQPGREIQMNTMENAEPYLVTVSKRASEFGTLTPSDRMSAALIKFDNGVQPALLPLIANPSLANNGSRIQIPVVQSSPAISSLATLLVLSKVQEFKQGTTVVQVLHNQWEVYAPGWVTVVDLPEWPNDNRIEGKKRWEANLIGNNQLIKNKVGRELIEAATHVTHSSVDFN